MQGAILAKVYRGELVESIHHGVVAVVDAQGRLIAQAGDPDLVTYFRSAAKPMQAVPVITSGAAARYGLSQAELAVLTSSHSGEEEHVQLVAGILDKLGLEAGELQCGTHLPVHRGSARQLLARGLEPTAFHNPCSGKHAGMLALALHQGWEPAGYYLQQHPVQQAMLSQIAVFTGLSPAEIPLGIDGCGVPVFALTIRNMALAYARFARPHSLSPQEQGACSVLARAMTSHPRVVAGEGRLATDLMLAGGTKFIAKDGAEGIFCVAIPEKGWGMAVKILDGSSRALGPVVIAALDQLGLLDKELIGMLTRHSRPIIRNNRDEEIGEIKAAFSLDKRGEEE